MGDVYLINVAIGLLSAIVDNVPLVAASMGMYPIADPGATEWLGYFVQDGLFWQFLAYCAGTGGSALIIGSAAGVAVMGLEKDRFRLVPQAHEPFGHCWIPRWSGRVLAHVWAWAPERAGVNTGTGETHRSNLG